MGHRQPSGDLIVVLDGGSERLAQADQFRQLFYFKQPQQLLIRCPRTPPPPQAMQELVQGYDTVTQITALADWLRRRQAQPPQRIWIATDPEHTARATLLARIALAGQCIQSSTGSPASSQPRRTPQAGSRCPENEPLARHRQHRRLAGASGLCPQTGAVRPVGLQLLMDLRGTPRCLPQCSGLRPRERRSVQIRGAGSRCRHYDLLYSKGHHGPLLMGLEGRSAASSVVPWMPLPFS